MIWCQYEQADLGLLRCTVCGHEKKTHYAPDKMLRQCRPIGQKPIARKVTKFAVAAALHVMRGSPKRTDEEIEKLYEICRQCGRFTKDACRLCGCRVTRKKVYLNKLAWADQHCDEGRW